MIVQLQSLTEAHLLFSRWYKCLKSVWDTLNGCLEFFEMAQSACKAAACQSAMHNNANREQYCSSGSHTVPVWGRLVVTWMRLNQCGGYAAQRGVSHLKCQRVRVEKRAAEKNRGSLLMFDRYTMLMLLDILSPVPALSYSKKWQ